MKTDPDVSPATIRAHHVLRCIVKRYLSKGYVEVADVEEYTPHNTRRGGGEGRVNEEIRPSAARSSTRSYGLALSK